MLKELIQNVCNSIFNQAGIKAFQPDALQESESVAKEMGDQDFFVIVDAAIIPSCFYVDDVTQNQAVETDCTEFDIDAIPAIIKMNITAYSKSIDMADNVAKSLYKTFSSGLNVNPENNSDETCKIEFLDERKVPKRGFADLYTINLPLAQSGEIPNIELSYQEPNKSISFSDHFELNEILAMYYYYMLLLNKNPQDNVEELKRRTDLIADCLGIGKNNQDKAESSPRSLKAATSYLSTIVSNPNSTMDDVVDGYR